MSYSSTGRDFTFQCIFNSNCNECRITSKSYRSQVGRSSLARFASKHHFMKLRNFIQCVRCARWKVNIRHRMFIVSVQIWTDVWHSAIKGTQVLRQSSKITFISRNLFFLFLFYFGSLFFRRILCRFRWKRFELEPLGWIGYCAAWKRMKIICRWRWKREQNSIMAFNIDREIADNNNNNE